MAPNHTKIKASAIPVTLSRCAVTLQLPDEIDPNLTLWEIYSKPLKCKVILIGDSVVQFQFPGHLEIVVDTTEVERWS